MPLGAFKLNSISAALAASGPAAKTIVAVGDASVTTLKSKFGGGSLYIDGSGDYLKTTDITDFQFGTGDFTVEAWCYFAATNTSIGIFQGPGQTSSFMFQRRDSNDLAVGQTNTAWNSNTSSGVTTAGVWQHIAVSRSGSTIRFFVDGTQVGSATNTINYQITTTASIGGDTYYGGSPEVWMEDLRVSNSARYTGSFTPPSSAFTRDSNTKLLLHFNGTNGSQSFIDDTGSNDTNTSPAANAVWFNGSDSYLAASSLNTSSASDSKYMTLAVNFYMNDWAYTGGQGTNLQHLVDVYLPGGNSFYVWINGGRLQIDGGISTVYEQAECSVTPFAWNQLVMYIDTSSRSNCRIYLNGTSRTLDTGGNPNNTNINWNTTGASVYIGRPNASVQSAGSYFNGAISHFYLHGGNVGAPTISNYWDSSYNRPKDLGTDGTATGLARPYVYHYGNTSTFTTNNGTGFSSYTLSGNNIGDAGSLTYTSSRTPLAITSYGNAQIGTDQYKFNYNSIKLDGSGDYIVPAASADLTDLTVELWYRPATLPGSGLVPLLNFNNTLMYIGYSGGTVYDFYNGGSRVALNAVTINTNTWYHVAFVRSGSAITVYHNGTSVATGTWGTAVNFATAGPEIGKYSSYYFNGWMDEIRISNTARYTGNFSVPTKQFKNDANTLLLIHATPGPNGGTVFYDDNGL